jgi:hypothetical protein
MINHWLNLANTILENEMLLLADNSVTRNWYFKMPATIPAICPDMEILSEPSHFTPQIGIVHHMRLTKLGVEGVLKAPKKYHKMAHEVYFDQRFTSDIQFWMVLRRNCAKF